MEVQLTLIFLSLYALEMRFSHFLFSRLVQVQYSFAISQVAIARGHPRLATDSYKKTLKELEFNEEDYLSGLHLPNASFVLKTVEELISILESSKSSCTS